MRFSTTTVLTVLAALTLLIGCGSDSETGPKPLHSTCAVDGDCPSGLRCNSAGLCTSEADAGTIDGGGATFGDASSSSGASSSGASSSGASSSGASSSGASSSGASSGASSSGTSSGSTSGGVDAGSQPDTGEKPCISSGECDDGNPCTDDFCDKGLCNALPKKDCCKVDKDCDDSLECTVDTCIAGGTCSHMPNGKSCFIDGKCVQKGQASASNACQVCDPAKSGTSYSESIGGSCDDGNPCSTNDACISGGMCVGTPKPGCCLSDVACVTGDACKTGTCDKTTNTCKIVTKQGCCNIDADCPGASNSCVKSFCNPATHTCSTSKLNDGASCDDGNGCTLKDSCQGGVCKGGTQGCDDGNPCTKDSCVAGKCQHVKTGSCCSTGACCNIGVGSTKKNGEKCGNTVRKIEYSCMGQIARRRYAFDGCDGVATTCTANKTLHFSAWQTVKYCPSGTTCVSKGTTYSCEGGTGGGTADLQSVYLKAGKTIYKPGEKFYILSTVRNGGKGHAGKFSVEYRLSTNTALTTADKLIGATTKTSLLAGQSTTANAWVTIPATTKPGTYYLFVWIDRLNQVKETTTLNNRRYIKITVSGTPQKGIDLAPQSFKSTKTSYKPGETVVFTGLIRNLGTVSSGTFTAEYRLSKDAIITTADPLLRVVTKPSLGANGSTSALTTGKLSALLTPGTYYLALWVDRSNKVKETNELNNRALYKITVGGSSGTGADLWPYAFKSTKTSYKAGESIIFTGFIRNLGKTSSGTYTAEYRLSTNSTITTGDPLLRVVTRPSLGAGATTSASTIAKIPATTKAGTYYIGLWVDRTNKVKESNESNNTAVYKITIGGTSSLLPDLAPYSFKSTKTVYKPGETVVFTGGIRNLGKMTAAPYVVDYRLSTNSSITTGDPLLRTVSKPSLGAGSSTSALTTGKIPLNIKPGTYYFGIWVDRTAKVKEGSETNNVAVYKVTIGTGSSSKPDLYATSLKTSKPAYNPGETVFIMSSVRNQGLAPAGAFTVEYRLSKTSLITTLDPLIATIKKTGLGPNSQTTANAIGKLPLKTAPGTYYVGMWIDRTNQVSELSTANNKRVFKITVGTSGANYADLVPIAFKPTKTTYTPGSQIVFTGSIRNVGKATASPFTVEYRLSKTSLLLTLDPLLKTISKGSLPVNGTTSALTYGVIPNTTKPGTYYVGIWLDRPNKVKESNENNNKAVYKITVSGFPIK